MATFLSSLALFVVVLATLYEVMETSTRGDCTWWGSWLQFVGLAIIGCWGAWRLYDVLNGAAVTPQQLLAHCGLAAYAIGHLFERWHAHREQPMRTVKS